MKTRKYRIFAGDFETTVYPNQTYTEVWAAACAELFTENVSVFHSISEIFEYLVSLDSHVIIYFHNLKFDGAFWLSYLLTELEYKQAYENLSEEKYENGNYKHVKWLPEKLMKNKTFKYSISDRGQWYSIIIKINGNFIEIRDSLKLLPFSIKRISESFATKHKKLEIEYTGFRYAGCNITDEEKEYISNDVLVLKEALEIAFEEGHTDLTIGACCLKEFKKTYDKHDYNFFFPNLYEFELDPDKFGSATIGDYIRKSYKGGWCYLVKGKENRVYNHGVTYDVNSLYPSMMHSESGNEYPVGKPKFWSGNFIPDEALKPNRYYFIRIKTRFYIKDGYLPFIQLKNNFAYKGTECLTTSDIYDPETDRYYTHFRSGKDTRVTLTLTMTDYILLKEHYELVDFEILDGCYFLSEIGLFDEYIDKYKEIKLKSKAARRELAKLFLNNLYGKMASSTDSSFKLAFVKPDGSIGFTSVIENDKKPGYIPIGSAITSYSRNFTIRAAQSNFHGVENDGFIYADTDSIHCSLNPEEISGITEHDSNFCCWKLESKWDTGFFVRQKTYIEHDEKGYNIKCAGMPDRCKQLFEMSLTGKLKEGVKLSDKDRDFLFDNVGNISVRGLAEFSIGLDVPGKLLPKRIKGGIVLVDTNYKMRN